MSQHNAAVMQSLEPRTLLSGHGFSLLALDPTVQADLDKIKADTQTLKADGKSAKTLLNADRAQIQTDSVNDAGVTAAKAQLQSDQDARAAAVKSWQTQIQTATADDRTAIQADLQKLLSDLGDPAARKVDLDKLKADRLALKDDIQPIQAAMRTDLDTRTATIQSDRDAVNAAIDNSATLKADRDKLTADQKTADDTLAADRTALKDDYVQLAKDWVAAWRTA